MFVYIRDKEKQHCIEFPSNCTFVSSAPKQHLNDFRKLVIKHHLNGDSGLETASQVLCSRNTIHPMITKYEKTKCTANLVGHG